MEKSKHIQFAPLTRTPSNDEAPLRGDGPGNTHYYANYSTTAPARLMGPQYFTTDAEKYYAVRDPTDKMPRFRGPGKRLLEDINEEWKVVGEIENTDDDDNKKVTLCNGDVCIKIIIGVALLAKLFGYLGKKNKRSRRGKKSKRSRHSYKKW